MQGRRGPSGWGIRGQMEDTCREEEVRLEQKGYVKVVVEKGQFGLGVGRSVVRM